MESGAFCRAELQYYRLKNIKYLQILCTTARDSHKLQNYIQEEFTCNCLVLKHNS